MRIKFTAIIIIYYLLVLSVVSIARLIKINKKEDKTEGEDEYYRGRQEDEENDDSIGFYEVAYFLTLPSIVIITMIAFVYSLFSPSGNFPLDTDAKILENESYNELIYTERNNFDTFYIEDFSNNIKYIKSLSMLEKDIEDAIVRNFEMYDEKTHDIISLTRFDNARKGEYNNSTHYVSLSELSDEDLRMFGVDKDLLVALLGSGEESFDDYILILGENSKLNDSRVKRKIDIEKENSMGWVTPYKN